MTSIALALGAALGWGIADFVGGATSRASSALVVLWSSQWVGFAIVLVAAAIVGLDSPTGSDLLFAAAAGGAMTLGLGALYGAMTVGAMSIAAPIAATGVAIPVVVGLASGDDPSGLQAAGLVAAVGGVILCSQDPESRDGGRTKVAAGVGLALLAALGGGLTSTALSEASSAGVLWVLMMQRGVAGAIALTIVLASGSSPRPGRRVLPAIALIGAMDLLATGLFTAATIDGELSLVAVVGSLYPVVTVVLAFAVLGESLARHQLIGAVAALAGVAAIAGG